MRKKIVFLSLTLFCLVQFVKAQQKLSGRILSEEDNEPLVGANVVLKGSKKGTFTNFEGKFILENVAAGEKVLLISMVGFKNLEYAVSATDSLEVVIKLSPSVTMLGNPIVYALRDYPITQTQINTETLEKQNFGQDLPILLNFQPSVQTTSDAGAGIGYTGIRIRGSDLTRINVTLNGIPVNDAESHGVFWVNTPDLASSIEQITVQRGVGTSVNGAGAFGASLNITTERPQKEAFASTSHSVGSFNTFRHNVEMGTGLLSNKFSLYGRLSKITSDGYIDKASVDLKSFFLSGTYTGKVGNFTANIFSGKEITFQAWNGVPEEFIKEGRRTYNELAKYDNEIDNYQQDHYQLLYDKQLSNLWKVNAALFYTKGRGYFEQYKENEKLSKYNMPNVVVGNEIIKRSDIIRRRWLDNDFYGMIFSTNYTSEKKRAANPVLDLNIGGGYNFYAGKHFGEVIWAQFMGNTPIRHRYYDNDAEKTDVNFYTKANYQLYDNLFAFADAQVRSVSYSFQGLASDANSNIFPVQQKVNLTFFNPKTGISYRLGNQEWYATYGVANKEPNRDDFTNSSTQSRPKHETLHNIELGYNKTWNKLAVNVNLYWMEYKNQLILTGQINDVGAYTRTNVPDSYRRGVELQTKWIISPKLSWEGNATFSRNKIRNFVEYLDDYDNGGQVAIAHGTTDIALSPNTLAASQLHFTPFRGMEISLLSKYVGKQYLDNTSSETRKINPYHTQDIRFRYSFQPKHFNEVQIGFLLNNVLNRLYESNGYTFGWIYEGRKTYQNYFYPQAGRNWLMTVTVKI